MSERTDLHLREVDDAFERALSLPPDERAQLLSALDPTLREQVEVLLALSHTGPPPAFAEAAPPARLGRWSVRGELGRGGMSIVYRGERDDGAFRQQVALKLMPFSDEALAQRFRRERQLLAGLNHPGIARLLDGGSDPDGRPFLVLELVDGVRVDEHCDARRLDVRQRLTLFVEIAYALEYAHSRLVVHRDIKPSNVLVTREGQVKLLDFGIATLLDAVGAQALTSAHLTPDYASPEQLAARPISTASDVYQLGLLLAVLLVGEVRGARRLSLEPVPLSEALDAPGVEASAIAARRNSSVAALRRALRHELDAVALKALAVEPGDRYPSVAALRADVQAWLEGRVVTAARTTLAYRLRKWVTRHPIAAVCGLVGIVGLGAYAATTTVQNRRIEAERRRAEQVKAFALSLFTASNPGNARGHVLTAQDLLERGVERVQRELINDPALRAEMLETLGDSYHTLGHLEAAAQLYTQVIDFWRRDGRLEHLVGPLKKLGVSRHYQARYGEAEGLLREALALGERSSGADRETTAWLQVEVASLLHSVGRDTEAEPVAREAAATMRSLGREEVLGTPLRILAQVLQARGALAEAEALLRESASALEHSSGGDDPVLILTRLSLTEVLLARGAVEEASTLVDGAGQVAEQVYQADNPMRAVARKAAGDLAFARGDIAQARRAYAEAVAALERWNPTPNPVLAGAQLGLARTDEDPALRAARIAADLSSVGLGEHPIAHQARALVARQ